MWYIGRPIFDDIPTYLVPLCPIFLEIPTYPKIGRPLWTFPKLRAYCTKEYTVPEDFATPSSFPLKYIPKFPNYSKSTSEREFRIFSNFRTCSWDQIPNAESTNHVFWWNLLFVLICSKRICYSSYSYRYRHFLSNLIIKIRKNSGFLVSELVVGSGAHCSFSSNSFHGQMVQKAVHQLKVS